MDPNWADVVSAIASAVGALATVVALIYAARAWTAAVQTYRGSYRPVLRPVPLRWDGSGVVNPARLLLKNIGLGPAVSVFILEPEPPAGQEWPLTHPGPIVATVDVVEPLGEALGDGETSRVGRVELRIPTARLLRRDLTYRVLYQDLGARWHESTFRDDDAGWSVRYLGAVKDSTVPSEVTQKAQIVHDEQ